MSDKLYVATRKGLICFGRESGAWRMTPAAFLGEPVTAVCHDPRDDTLYAALNLGHFGVKLHRSDDGGENWTELPVPAFAADNGSGDGDTSADGPSVSLIWTLVSGGADNPGRLWAGTIPGGLFVSDDRGDSWALVESLWNLPEREKWMGGGYDDPGIHSISLDPGNSKRMAIAVSTGGVWLSDDGGETWRLGGEGLRAEYVPPESANDPLFQDVHRISRCATDPDRIWLQHHNGIFVSDDGGATFREIENAEPSAFGFAVAAHPVARETAWFVPAIKDQYRLPVDQRLVVSRTGDSGGSFETLSRGLPDQPTFDLVYRHGLDVNADGSLIAIGSTTGNLWVGTDGGAEWQSLSNYLAPINQVLWAARA